MTTHAETPGGLADLGRGLRLHGLGRELDQCVCVRMQRLWRDIRVASRHAIRSWTVNLEIYGKALLGVEPDISPLI